MRVLIIRHAAAEVQAAFAKRGEGDEGRPLTAEGWRRMRAAAAGLRRVVKGVDVLATSPLTRAVQTAQILCKENVRLKAVETDVLKPGKPLRGVLSWLQGQREDATVALVGHEPQLGMLVSWLLTGEQRSFVELRKGSATLIEFDDAVKPGSGKLLWMLKPSQLRQLA